MRIVTSLVQPLLFLFVLGSGLQQLSSASTHGVNLKTFIYPGILCISVMFTAMFSAASIVWDREFGFLREMMVAPVRRSSIVIGKCLGGATVASIQGVIVILLGAGWWASPTTPLLILGIFVLQLLLAFAITAFGVMVAARIKQMQSFMGVMQMIVMPMFFISGALFPVAGLPALAGRAQPPRPAHLRRRPDAPARVQPPRRSRRRRGRRSTRASPGSAGTCPALLEVGDDRRARPGHARDRDLGVQHDGVSRGTRSPLALARPGQADWGRPPRRRDRPFESSSGKSSKTSTLERAAAGQLAQRGRVQRGDPDCEPSSTAPSASRRRETIAAACTSSRRGS